MGRPVVARIYITVEIDPPKTGAIDPEAARAHIETVLQDVADGYIGDPANPLEGATILARIEAQ